MTQHAKKPAHHASYNKKTPFQSFEKAEEKVLEMEREGMENIMQAAGSVNKAASECAAACSDNMGACIESGNTAIHAMQNMGSEVTECCNRTLSDFAEISRDAMACRSLSDMVELQNKAIQQVSDNYFSTVNKLSGMVFNFFNQAVEPFGERAASVTRHVRKAFAA